MLQESPMECVSVGNNFLSQLSPIVAQSPPLQDESLEIGSNSENLTLYISSSMFRELNATKLSSEHQTAKVFFFPGATAGEMLHRLSKDTHFRQIDARKVKKVFLLCGTNNIDKILNIPRHYHSNFVENARASDHLVNEAKMEIDRLVIFIHGWAINAQLNIINILPRVSLARNTTINELNKHIG